MSTLHIIVKMNRHAKQLCHPIQKRKAFVYNEVILVKIWNHHIYLWNYTQYLLVHQRFAFSDVWPFVEKRIARRSSPNRPAGTPETKVIYCDKETYRRFTIEKKKLRTNYTG